MVARSTAVIPYPAVDRHPATVFLARLSPGSRRTMAHSLGIAASVIGGTDAFSFPWWQLGYQHVAAFRTYLTERYSPATCRKVLSGVKGVVKESWRLGLMTAEEKERATDVAPVRGERLPPGRSLTVPEIAALFGACDDSNRGRRDRALLALLIGCGLRRSEVVALDVSDFDGATILVRNAKGNRDRRLPLPEGAVSALSVWLERRGLEPGPLLVAVVRPDEIVYHRLTGQWVLKTLQRLAQAASVKTFSAHDCRRTYITTLLEAGVDLFTVAKLSGHRQLRTLEKYDRRGLEATKRAVENIRIPF